MLDLYDDYLQDPSSVPEDLQVLFSTIKTGEAHIEAKPTTDGVVHKREIAQLNVLCA